MSYNTGRVENEINNLADDASALLEATADVAGEKVGKARARLSTALESNKQVWNNIQAKAREKAEVADAAIRENPYQAIGLAVGVGVLIGLLLRRRD